MWRIKFFFFWHNGFEPWWAYNVDCTATKLIKCVNTQNFMLVQKKISTFMYHHSDITIILEILHLKFHCIAGAICMLISARSLHVVLICMAYLSTTYFTSCSKYQPSARGFRSSVEIFYSWKKAWIYSTLHNKQDWWNCTILIRRDYCLNILLQVQQVYSTG